MKKILSFNDLPSKIGQIQAQGSIVLVGGCFDILHDGHTTFLKEAKKHADILIVVLESDESVKKRKGNNRPVNTQEERAVTLSHSEQVSYVLPIPNFLKNEDYYKLTNVIKPDIIAVTKGDPLLNVKKDQAKMVGGKVIEVLERLPNLSTTNIVEKNIYR